jgi:hypothetical protein
MRKWVLWLIIIVAALATGFTAGYFVNPVGIPYTVGYVDGQRIRFIHPEVSDQKVAELLTEMLNSPVLVVPSLAQAPESMLADVYVFTNGVKKGEGPFKFTADVFDRPPGRDGYSPLRAVHLVAWKSEGKARELKSVAEVKAAEAAGEITVTKPGRVVNMPFLTWPGGRR